MAERFEIVIVGAGPAGLNAAWAAAKLGKSYVVLERAPLFADTIQKYQRGKHVMATPDLLPLHPAMPFEAGSREAVLGGWAEQIEARKLAVRHGAEVTRITGKKGDFTVTLKEGTTVAGEAIVLAMGVQGDLNRLNVPGDAPPMVQYQLDDPKKYEGERILVVGASDSAIENAIALSEQNSVTVVNRGDGFPRAKPANAAAIERAAKAKKLEIAYKATTAAVTQGMVTLNVPEGRRDYPCDRVIARLGGQPPRRFLESCGIAFPKVAGARFPQVSTSYETSVPGLYVIGDLAGYPIIKQCMNQGYEVVHIIAGCPVEPADTPLLSDKLLGMPGRPLVDDGIERIRTGVALFRGLNPLQLREFMLDSEMRVLLAGEVLFRHNEFGDTLFCIVDGEVVLTVPDLSRPEGERRLSRRSGDFFGEAGLIAGRRRAATAVAVTDTVVIELARRSAVKLLGSEPSAKRLFDRVTILRQLQEDLLPELGEAELAPVLDEAKFATFKPGETLIEEGDEANQSVFLIRSGSVSISRRQDGKDLVVAYEAPGRLIGEVALLRRVPRTATVRAAIATEAIRIDGALFQKLLELRPELRARIETALADKLVRGQSRDRTGGDTGYRELVEQTGVGEGTDVLLIDESLCIRCDNCEKACAESHDGITRLDREAGPTFAMLHVPTSCRHCQHPHCMTECPPDAIHRAENGEVWIDDSCIGCGKCVENCPYDVIQLATAPPKKPGLLSWLLLGLGHGPGEDKARRGEHHDDDHGQAPMKKAVKCDMCRGIDGGAACVRACPTGAAIRVSPAEFFDSIGRAP